MKLISKGLLNIPQLWPTPKWEMKLKVKVQLLKHLKDPMREYIKVDVMHSITRQVREDFGIE